MLHFSLLSRDDIGPVWDFLADLEEGVEDLGAVVLDFVDGIHDLDVSREDLRLKALTAEQVLEVLTRQAIQQLL